MATTVFWVSLAVLSYVYLGYPGLLQLWSTIVRRKVRRSAWEPSVAVVIAVYNEKQHIEAKIQNLLELDYPEDKLEVILSLDGPTDGTEAIVRKYRSDRVSIVELPEHRGKAAALNAALDIVLSEVVVYADARQMLDRRALRELVADLHDPRVGVVTGELVINGKEGREASDGVGLYWRYEKRIRALESAVHSVVGATGALYAIRRSLVRPIPDDAILDDVLIPMHAVLQGYRIIFQPHARVHETQSHPPEIEFRRKTRTLMGNYQLLAFMPQLLLPWSNPLFVQFLSHKIGRLLAPWFLLALLLSNAFLAGSPLYATALAAQLIFYCCAVAGHFLSRGGGNADLRAVGTRTEEEAV
jgi:poly-beta-1,6-N-acetyl-D-glucosamine synthase